MQDNKSKRDIKDELKDVGDSVVNEIKFNNHIIKIITKNGYQSKSIPVFEEILHNALNCDIVANTYVRRPINNDLYKNII